MKKLILDENFTSTIIWGEQGIAWKSEIDPRSHTYIFSRTIKQFFFTDQRVSNQLNGLGGQSFFLINNKNIQQTKVRLNLFYVVHHKLYLSFFLAEFVHNMNNKIVYLFINPTLIHCVRLLL